MVKATQDLDELLGERSSLGVAVLSVPEEMTWTQLHALLDLSSFAMVTGTAAGIAGVPLGDLFALANAVAGLVGGAVTIEDPARRVLAYRRSATSRSTRHAAGRFSVVRSRIRRACGRSIARCCRRPA